MSPIKLMEGEHSANTRCNPFGNIHCLVLRLGAVVFLPVKSLSDYKSEQKTDRE
ncbi:MAG: hypothetical protein SPI35_07375 [Porphyromonas sp.]|nr:hypothetical protein [Porphyromonas sp.]